MDYIDAQAEVGSPDVGLLDGAETLRSPRLAAIVAPQHRPIQASAEEAQGLRVARHGEDSNRFSAEGNSYGLPVVGQLANLYRGLPRPPQQLNLLTDHRRHVRIADRFHRVLAGQHPVPRRGSGRLAHQAGAERQQASILPQRDGFRELPAHGGGRHGQRVPVLAAVGCRQQSIGAEHVDRRGAGDQDLYGTLGGNITQVLPGPRSIQRAEHPVSRSRCRGVKRACHRAPIGPRTVQGAEPAWGFEDFLDARTLHPPNRRRLTGNLFFRRRGVGMGIEMSADRPDSVIAYGDVVLGKTRGEVGDVAPLLSVPRST